MIQVASRACTRNTANVTMSLVAVTFGVSRNLPDTVPNITARAIIFIPARTLPAAPHVVGSHTHLVVAHPCHSHDFIPPSVDTSAQPLRFSPTNFTWFWSYNRGEANLLDHSTPHSQHDQCKLSSFTSTYLRYPAIKVIVSENM